MLVVRQNARVKLVCEENPALSAICASGNLPAANLPESE
jgi:hypothetical protein